MGTQRKRSAGEAVCKMKEGEGGIARGALSRRTAERLHRCSRCADPARMPKDAFPSELGRGLRHSCTRFAGGYRRRGRDCPNGAELFVAGHPKGGRLQRCDRIAALDATTPANAWSGLRDGQGCVIARYAGSGGGEGGIRTPGTLAGTSVFETDPIDHSGTSPGINVVITESVNERWQI